MTTLNKSKISVLNSTTDEYITSFIARVVTDDLEIFQFGGIIWNNGDFSVKHSIANYGIHQIIVRVDTNSTINSASYKVIIPYQSSSSQFLTDSVKSKLNNDKKMKIS